MKLFIAALAVAVISGLAAIASPPSHILKRATVSDVEKSLSLIISDIDALVSAINALPTSGATLSDVVPIGLNALVLAGDITDSTADFQSITGTVPNSDAISILATSQDIESAVINVVNLLVSKQTVLESVIPGAALLGLTTFRTLTDNIATAMATVAPISTPAHPIVPPSMIFALRTSMDNAFATAITAFGG
ncbi:hypothetical protein M422DRAFT_35796 [Sphaerobolus stellatus SS14]|uniref:Hydrophobic surface binding protein n=1 Tax=Sphaerobolus stellatus (strain SS14) TaxID=990650 RepID=A0A0C9V4U4_SPHS4|nr:hypothetical protein M422DRAFT_35796 [Sphaerobolus stellatus SS14]